MKVFKAFLGALFLFAALPAFAASTKSDYQKDFDFGRLHTFAFKMERDSKDPLATNTIEATRIQNALAAQLEAKGFTQSNDNPDFIVAFYSRTQEKTRVNSTGFGFGPGWGWGYGVPFRGRWRWGLGPDIWTSTYLQGCVMADIIDTNTQELVWRGVVQDTVHGIGQSEKEANNAAKDLVQRFLKDTRKVEKRRSMTTESNHAKASSKTKKNRVERAGADVGRGTKKTGKAIGKSSKSVAKDTSEVAGAGGRAVTKGVKETAKAPEKLVHKVGHGSKRSKSKVQ